MASKPDQVIEKCTVLSVAEGKPWKDKDGKEHQQWDVVLKEGDEVYYGTASKLRDDVKEKAEIERVMLYKNKVGDKEYTKFFFPTEDSRSSGGGGKYSGGYRGISPEEMSLKRFDSTSRVVGVAFSYAVDILKDNPDVDIEKVIGWGNDLADAMWEKSKKLLGLDK